MLTISLKRALFATSSTHILCIRYYRERNRRIMCDTDLPQLSTSEKNAIGDTLKEMRLKRKDPYFTVIKRIDKEEADELLVPPQSSEQPDGSEPLKEEKPKKRKESLLYDTTINKNEFTPEQYAHLQSLKSTLSDPDTVQSRDVESLMKEVGITESERLFITNEMNTLLANRKRDAPMIHNAVNPNMDVVRDLMKSDDSIMKSLESWYKEVEKAVGKPISDAEHFSEEDLAKIPPAPPRLEEIAKLMMGGKTSL